MRSDGSYLEDQDYWKYSGIERNVFIQMPVWIVLERKNTIPVNDEKQE